MFDYYKEYCLQLQDQSRYRTLSPENSPYDLDFSSNDYLALSQNPALIQTAIDAAQQYGMGATGSRLLSGNHALFSTFEKQIAKDKKTESALIFNSGFQANSSALSCLLDSRVLKAKPLVFFDKLNHASLYQALFLSQAELLRYHHNDMDHLSDLLKRSEAQDRARFIVSETVFGMDGDQAELNTLLSLAREYQCFLYLDEAHATGLLGKTGYGLSPDLDFNGLSYLVMGTFSKALGSAGAYVACTESLKNYLVNRAPGFMYSTALPPMLMAVAAKAWEMVFDLNEARSTLLEHANFLRTSLKNLGFNIGASNTHLIPIIIGDEIKTLNARKKLLQARILVSAIRPPSVPVGSSRLRIALTLAHSKEDLQVLLQAMKTL